MRQARTSQNGHGHEETVKPVRPVLTDSVKIFAEYLYDKSFNEAEDLEQLGRIFARIHQCLNLVHHALAVFRISDAEPLAGRIEHFAGRRTVMNQLVYHQGDEKLALEVLHVLRVAEEGLEEIGAVSKIVGSKAPEVHADRSSLR